VYVYMGVQGFEPTTLGWGCFSVFVFDHFAIWFPDIQYSITLYPLYFTFRT
jgi:hypothetical protein